MRDRLALHTTALSIAVVILAPLARPGYVLSYDMNFVPRQPLRLDLIAPVSSAPRAVPLDAAVSLANLVMPGWLLQRVVLVAIIWAAVVGAGRLVPTDRLIIRVIAAAGYGWTPFLAERLLLGQWGLLIAYAAMPWLVMAAWRQAMPQLAIAAGLCALTPSGGLIAALVCLVLVPVRRWALLGGILLLVNLPWLVAALVSEAGQRSDPAGVAAFAARGENWAGPLAALAGTGGVWNAETTPASRASPLIPLVTLGLLVLAFCGYQIMHRRKPNRLWIAALAGLALAALSSVHIGVSTWLVQHVPGAGLLRDSQKFLLPYVLLLMVCVALGAERLAQALPAEAGKVLLAGMLIVPVVTMPDLAFGGAGALRPVEYPADWAAVARLIEQRPGPILDLPLSEYRKYQWNHQRVVLDPAARFFASPVLADDTLVVGETTIAGEDKRLSAIRSKLAAGDPVASPGLRWVLVQHDGNAAEVVAPTSLSGLEPVYLGRHLALYANPAASVSGVDDRRGLWIVAAEIVAFLTLIAAAVTMAALPRR